jgi:hypothetical protein
MKPLLSLRTSVQIILSLLAVFLCNGAVAQDPMARSSLEVKGDLWVGQKAVWVVDLLVPGYFSGTPAFDIPEVPGLLILPSEGHPSVENEQVNGVSYTTQRWELPVFAQRKGEYQLPGIQVRLAFKRNPLDTQSVAASVGVPGVQFAAKLPPGANEGETLLSARDFKIEEEWKPQPEKAKPGDAFIRTVTFSASDIPGMAFPSFPFSPIEGLGIYRRTPEVLDQSERGDFRGMRRETITYVCERPGRYTIPSYQMTWWNLAEQKLETIKFQKQNIRVEGAGSPVRPSLNFKVLLGGLIALLFLAGAGIGFGKFPLGLCLRQALRPWKPVHLAPLNPNSRRQPVDRRGKNTV